MFVFISQNTLLNNEGALCDDTRSEVKWLDGRLASPLSQCIKTRMWISINFTLQMLTICTCHIGDAPNNERQLYTEINGKK